MKRSYIFLGTGFEDVEAITPADVMRRAGLEVSLVSINKQRQVTGSHGITIDADFVIESTDFSDADWLILPGGLPGAHHLAGNEMLTDLLKKHAAAGGRIAAICAAPGVVLAPLGLLEGKEATAYPGFDSELAKFGATPRSARVVADGNFITGNGPSSALPFALAIVAATAGKDVADDVADGMLVNF